MCILERHMSYKYCDSGDSKCKTVVSGVNHHICKTLILISDNVIVISDNVTVISYNVISTDHDQYNR